MLLKNLTSEKYIIFTYLIPVGLPFLIFQLKVTENGLINGYNDEKII